MTGAVLWDGCKGIIDKSMFPFPFLLSGWVVASHKQNLFYVYCLLFLLVGVIMDQSTPPVLQPGQSTGA